MSYKRERKLKIYHYCWMAALLCLSPLSGLLFLDVPLAPYLEFPPQTRYIMHAPFQWSAFLLLIFVYAAGCFVFLYCLITAKPVQEKTKKGVHPFPWWSWLGSALVLLFWVLAWSRFSFFSSLQRYTFFPLWLGYLLVVNGLSCKRKGSCLLLSQPRFFLALFPASTLFWWYFEYLNRFVQNWHYLGNGNISAAEYVLHASICFSTVLPAVLSTNEFLGTFPRLAGAFAGRRAITSSHKKGTALLMLGAAVISLAFLAVFPDQLFPMIWIAPLLIIVGIRLINRQPTIFSGLENGDWQHIVLPALAALICGFFWEMWNWKSLAHWQYSIPFVDRFHLFAMPLLGYAGYLPFGLECIAAASLVKELVRKDAGGNHISF